MFDISNVNDIDFDLQNTNEVKRFNLQLIKNPIGEYWKIPVLISKGKSDGPVVGICASVHGNELNGISVIHKLFDYLRKTPHKGVVVGALVVNIPGFLDGKRECFDGQDLNRLMPGDKSCSRTYRYAHAFTEKFIKKVDYLIDLHTASFGRINSRYVRADLHDHAVKQMAVSMEAQIIVNVAGEDGTVRSAAKQLNIPAITVEVGDPKVFQNNIIDSSLIGVINTLKNIDILDEEYRKNQTPTIFCTSSYWLYANEGGILEVLVGLCDIVSKSDVVAKIYNIFGDLIEEVLAPEKSVIVSKSTDPVCHVGSRLVHFGLLEKN